MITDLNINGSYPMKTNAQKSREVLETLFYNFDDVEDLKNELLLFIRNYEPLNTALIENRRKQIHSIAWQSMFDYVDELDPTFRRKGFYISSPQMKAFILHKWEMDYKALLAPLCKELEKIRNDYLK